MTHLITKRFLGAAIMAAALITPAIASAQDAAYAGDQHVQGRIASINGTWNITVNDADGYTDSVELHQGTIINPTGLTLEPGMEVTVAGYPDGSNFDATEIDTPYRYSGPPPTAVYYGPGAWYPGYAYGWGPSFSLVFNLGNRDFERREFAYGGEYRRPIAPPPAWQDRRYPVDEHRGDDHPARFAPERSYGAPREQRSFAAPQQQRWSAPQQQQHWSAPQQQQRSFAAPHPSDSAQRDNSRNGEHRRD